MKTIEWAEWTTMRRAGSGAALAMAGSSGPIARRCRTCEERAMIVRGTVALMRRRMREGRLVRLGPREYELVAEPTHTLEPRVH